MLLLDLYIINRAIDTSWLSVKMEFSHFCIKDKIEESRIGAIASNIPLLVNQINKLFVSWYEN